MPDDNRLNIRRPHRRLVGVEITESAMMRDQAEILAELERSREGKVFFEAIASMAHTLGMEVVAEGVETAGQLVARPMPAAAIAPLLARRRLFDQALAV